MMERHFDTPSPIAQSWFDEHVVIVNDSDDFIIGSARTTITQMRPMTADDPANTNHIAVPECSENHEEDYFPFDFTTTTTDFVTNSFAHGGNQCNDNHNKVMSMMFDVNNFSHFIDSDPTVEVNYDSIFSSKEVVPVRNKFIPIMLSPIPLMWKLSANEHEWQYQQQQQQNPLLESKKNRTALVFESVVEQYHHNEVMYHYIWQPNLEQVIL